MTFLCVIINYIDRSCISVAAPDLTEELGIDSIKMGSSSPPLPGEMRLPPLQKKDALFFVGRYRLGAAFLAAVIRMNSLSTT
jgi:hypothetical protein